MGKLAAYPAVWLDLRKVGPFLGITTRPGGLKSERHSYLQKLYDLHPDPSGAYVDIILAVEAVSCPLFLPADKLPTLGKVIAHLEAAGAKYEYVLADRTGAPGSPEGVVAMLSDIWEGHSDRHAGGPLCVPVSQESAEAAFSVAVTLVQLFSKGAVRPRSRT